MSLLNIGGEMASGSNIEKEPLRQKWESEKGNGFDCNICLDSANEPVITLCGHLYCWPCIYKWLHVQTSSPDLIELPKCPVCKSDISESSLVPLYGRGTSSPNFDRKRSQADQIIPRRPQAIGTHSLITPAPVPNHEADTSNTFQSRHQQLHHHQEYLPHAYSQLASSDFGPPAMASFFSPTVGMFREMVLTRIFGGLDHVSMLAYHHPNSVVLGTPSPRMRRHEMQLDKSLNRVSIFLFCCFILCLLLF
ncbi:E3 ubiquitin-protein ligase RMA3-like [Impatiens glandulifera]|uniref:E3 ubiquitin-protein ligase RMA3-like n=1 Tax=Impatiens glandulifera TaxID=253017 RepID=UPI001FB12EC6|nr:E3 ubiquitin-protein ligase RMA3-like [Impatiens glandulifera]